YDRLSDFGWNPDHPDWSKLKEHLHYYQLIDLPPLDTEEGGEMLERIVDRDGARLVVIDTLSRVVTGGENDNDTFKSLYRHTEIRLKRKGVTVHRLDHLGKDPAKGSRGGSAKEDSLDVVWQMERSSAENTVILTKTKGRQDGYPARLTIHLTTVNGVTSFTTADKMPDWLPDLVAQVDALGLPDSTGVPTVQKALKDAGIGRRRADLVLVVRFRKAREHLGNTPWEQFREHPGTQPEETLMNVDETEWEHPREHPGTPGVGVSHPIGGNTPWPGVETDDDYEPTLDDLESVDDYPLEEVEL
ncbi:MAG: AAA family ATPase, partial [Actinobacteria bacterium]|nr:AAA family ATPase [Actinomycetota bacterium]